MQEKFPSGQTRHWRYQPGVDDTTFKRRRDGRRDGEEGEGEEESEGLAGAPSHSEGQQKHLWPSPQNLINHSAPTDPDCGDLCRYKHLCLQFLVKKNKKNPHTHQRIYCFCCLADLLNSPFLFSLAQAHNRSGRGGLFGPRRVFFFFCSYPFQLTGLNHLFCSL